MTDDEQEEDLKDDLEDDLEDDLVEREDNQAYNKPLSQTIELSVNGTTQKLTVVNEIRVLVESDADADLMI